jgi:tetratricopeptide (TPR) repeat protein
MVTAFLFGILARPIAPAGGGIVVEGRKIWQMSWLEPIVGLVLLATAVPHLRGEYFGEEARVALRDQRYREARGLAMQALVFDKNNPELYYYLGRAAHFMTGEAETRDSQRALEEEAASSFQRGLDLFPRDTRLLIAYGQVLDLLARYSEADPFFQRAIENDPNLGTVYANSGIHWELQQRFDIAQRCWLKARDLGEGDISTRGLQRLEDLKHNPLIQSISPGLFGN